MGKSKKRTEQRRAARIARAHATPLSETKKGETVRRSSANRRSPARSIARYPWAMSIILLLIIAGIATLYVNHIGPFAPEPLPSPVAKSANAASPCTKANILSQITDTSAAPSADAMQKIKHTYDKEPTMAIDQNKVYCIGMNTNRGLIVLELDPQLAPHTVNNFVFLAQQHYYDGLKFHRVLPGTIIQGGDPKGDGSGGPGYTINDELVQGNYTAGTIAMAKTNEPNSAGSQFFINLKDNTTTFSKDYTIFGRVVQGLDVAQKIHDPSTGNTTPDVMTHVIAVAA